MGKETKTFGITRAHLEEDAGQNLVYNAMCAYKNSPVQPRNLFSFPFSISTLLTVLTPRSCIQCHAYNVMHTMSCIQCHVYNVMHTISCI